MTQLDLDAIEARAKEAKDGPCTRCGYERSEHGSGGNAWASSLDRHPFKGHEAASSSTVLALVQKVRALEMWADRMPDAGITTDDPRLAWWYERPTTRNPLHKGDSQ
jgi:hypothetical protein